MTVKTSLIVTDPREINSIKCIDNAKSLPYKTGEKKKNKEHYRRYRYNGIVFIVDELDPFRTAEGIGYVKFLQYEETPEGETEPVQRLEFDSFGTREDDILGAQHVADLAKIEATSKGAFEMNDAILNLLQEKSATATVAE
jgi:hypothetical protein